MAKSVVLRLNWEYVNELNKMFSEKAWVDGVNFAPQILNKFMEQFVKWDFEWKDKMIVMKEADINKLTWSIKE